LLFVHDTVEMHLPRDEGRGDLGIRQGGQREKNEQKRGDEI
jgi:hypothetical protein